MKIVIALLFILTCTNTYSQQTSNITGRVTDEATGLPIAKVAVAVINDESIIAGSKTKADGFFSITEVEVGEYSIRLNLVGYNTLLIDNIVVVSGEPTDLRIEMSIVSTEEISVEENRFVKPNDVVNSIKSLRYEEIRRSPGVFEDVCRVLQTLTWVR